jgi:hypothetical protein
MPYTNRIVHTSGRGLRSLEYIWVSTKILEKVDKFGIPSFEMDMNFLVLRWKEDGVAERAGVASLSLYGDQFESLLQECEPILKPFWVV